MNGNILLNHLIPYNNYFLVVPSYDTKWIRKKLKGLSYNPIFAQNKRNIIDSAKIIKFNDREKKIYNKRLVIEKNI